MKVGWVSKYDTSMIQCLCFCLFWGWRQGREPLSKFDVNLHQSCTF